MTPMVRQRGFSLLEMMLVLLIMGALVSIVVVNLVGQDERAKTKITTIRMEQIENALDQYKFEKGSYPTAEESLVVLVTGKYLTEIPLDGWNNEFLYYIPSANPEVPFDLISLGPDATPNTEDDIFNWTLQ